MTKKPAYITARLVLFLLSPFVLHAQTSIPNATPVVQNFNGIGNTATAALPANWKMSSAGTGLTSNWLTGTNVTATTQAASTGTPTIGGRYNWATTAGTDRAVGFMTDAAYVSPNSIMTQYKNTTGGYISGLTISFNIERYVVNTNTVSVAFYTSADGTIWTAQTAGDVPTTAFTTGSTAYLFDGPTTVSKTVTLNKLAIANNADIYVRWVFTNTSNTNAQGLGLDDVTLTANTAVPTLTASLGDNLTDANGNGVANPGETIVYRDTIKNSGAASALGVTLTNTAPAGTTYTAGTVKSSALARDDSYSTAVNPTVLNVNTIGTGVLNNDYGLPSITVATFGPTVNGAATVAGSAGTTNNVGTLTVNANGTFTYTPAAGFTGIDQFKYIATTSVGLPNNDAIVSITVGTPATAVADAYPVTGNVSITFAAPGVLSNDAGTGTKTVTSINGSAANVGVNVTTGKGGILNIAANGSFTYNPPPGYEGTDVVSYTVDNGLNQPSSGTLTFTITGMIWFVNNNATTNGDGRLSAPFKQTSDFQLVNNGTGNNPAANDNIFFYESATDYVGAITLLTGQKLIGQDATSTLATLTGITPAAGSPALPAMNTSGNASNLTSTGITLTVVSNNAIHGFTLGNATTCHLLGTAFGTLTVKDVIVAGTGQAMNLSGGAFAATSAFISVASTSSASSGLNLGGVTGTVSFGSTTISGAATQGIAVGTTTATIDFGNTTVASTGDGISLQNNASGTKTFGTLSITTPGTVIGFLHATGGGPVVAGATTINNTSSGIGNGIDINAPNAAITFGATTVNKLGAGIAIDLGNTAATVANISFASVTAGTSGARLTGQGVSIINTGGTNTSTYSFGAVSIYTTGVTAFIATDVDGTINTTSGIIDALTSTAINVNGPAGFTTLGLVLTTVNSTGGTNNISIVDATGTANLGNGAIVGTATGAAFNISGGNPIVTYSGNITQNAANRIINIDGTTANAVTFQTGIINGGTTSTGVNINAVNGSVIFANGLTLGSAGSRMTQPTVTIAGGTGTYTFNALNLYTTGASALAATLTDGTITSTSGVIDALNGTAITISGLSAANTATVNLTLSTVNSTGGLNNVLLTNCTGPASLGTGTLSGATSNAFDVTGGNTAVTYAGTITNTAAARVVNIASNTGGIKTFNGAISGTINSTGINLSSNTGATINFTGGINLNTAANAAFTATGGGTVSATQNNSTIVNTITTTTGSALNVANTTIGASGLTFRSISSNGGSATGIILDNTGTTGGGFTITGIGTTAGSGGTIANKTGADLAVTTGCGMYLNITEKISLSNMNFTGPIQNFGIRGKAVNNFTLKTSNFTGQFGTNSTGGVVESTIHFGTQGADGTGNGLTGTAIFNGNSIGGGFTDNLGIFNNNTGSLNITIADEGVIPAIFEHNVSTGNLSNDGVLIETRGNNGAIGAGFNLTLSVTGVEFKGARGDNLQTVATSNSTQNITILNNTFHNTHPQIVTGGGGIAVTGAGNNYVVNYNVESNSFRGAKSSPIHIAFGGTEGDARGTVLNNIIGVDDPGRPPASTAQLTTGASDNGNGINMYNDKSLGAGVVTHATRIQGNQIRDVTGIPIYIRSNGPGPLATSLTRVEATILNNIVEEVHGSVGGGTFSSLYIVASGGGFPDQGKIGVNIRNNTFHQDNTSGMDGDHNAITFDQGDLNGYPYLPGYTGAMTDGAAISNFLVNAPNSNVMTNGYMPIGTGFVYANAEVHNEPFVLLPVPLYAAHSPSTVSKINRTSLAEVKTLLQAALKRFEKSGVTKEEMAKLRKVKVAVSDLPVLFLGASNKGTITIDSDAAGFGWFVDKTPGDDVEFNVSEKCTVLNRAVKRIDLLTVLMHELGHHIGLGDDMPVGRHCDLMQGNLKPGERRIPSIQSNLRKNFKKNN